GPLAAHRRLTITEALGVERPRAPLEFALPPGAGPAPRGDVGEAVAVDRDAYEAGRRCRERVAREERGHHLRRRQEACEQRLEVARAGSRAEEQEPELEVNPRLVRGDEGRRPRGVAGLVAELVGQAGRAVRGAL